MLLMIMILIISTDFLEVSTEMVIDWIEAKGHSWKRVNGESFQSIEFINLDTSPTDLLPEKVSVCWVRRLHSFRHPCFNTPSPSTNQHLKSEAVKLIYYFIHEIKLQNIHVLWPPGTVNKLNVLATAKRLGIKIPATAIVSSKEALKQFIKNFGPAICKPISESDTLTIDGKPHAIYTQEVDVDLAGETFFPTLVQNKVDKEFEIRVFYLDGEMYSMAIFSQQHKATSLDYRNYQHEKPNRWVPFRLPEGISQQIQKLMESLGLVMGSIDLIRSTEKEYVFLEVNPSGQFEMVSLPCNYHLEEKIANYLIRKKNKNGE